MNTKKRNNKPRPTIVLGDIHGSTYWETVVTENPGFRYIFLGDYLDPYENIPRNQLTDKAILKIVRNNGTIFFCDCLYNKIYYRSSEI